MRRFERMKASMVVAERRVGITEDVGNDTKVLLDHPGQSALATGLRDAMRIVEEPGRRAKVTAPLGDGTEAVERLGLPALIVQLRRDIEAAAVQHFRLG